MSRAALLPKTPRADAATFPLRTHARSVASRSAGQPLDAGMRGFMERRFGRDFSDVRVHTGGGAADATRRMDAIAYTVGPEIVFGSGRYEPETMRGRHLLAHELAHVVQQRGGVDLGGGTHRSGERYEREADRAADDAVLHDRSVVIAAGSGFGTHAEVQRQQKESTNPVPESATGGVGGLAQYESILREMYVKIDVEVFTEAQYMLSQGVPVEVVAKWATDARNEAKLKVREWDLLKRWAELRNVKRYGNKVGPSYEQLRSGDPAHNIKPKSNLEIVESAGRANPKVTAWSGRLRIAGRLLLVIDLGVAAYKVATAPPEDRPKVFIKEATGLAGALAVGAAGAEGGAYVGGIIGAWFGGAGAAPGAAIGALLGGIGGGIVGAYGGGKAGDWLVDELYPVKETRLEEAK